MNREEQKKVYEAPMLTVVSFKAERGYALSGGATLQKVDEVLFFEYNNNDDPYVTQYDQNDSWASYNW